MASVAQHRAHGLRLIWCQVTRHDVPASWAESSLQIERREDHSTEHRCRAAGLSVIDRVDDHLGYRPARIVPRVSVQEERRKLPTDQLCTCSCQLPSYELPSFSGPSGLIQVNDRRLWCQPLAPSARHLQHGAHRSTKALEAAIATSIDARNADLKPFRWTETADGILGFYCTLLPSHSTSRPNVHRSFRLGTLGRAPEGRFDFSPDSRQ